MKNFVTGWRRAPSAAGRPATTTDAPRRPAPEIVEPAPAPPTRRKSPPPEAEVIDARPPRPARPLSFPAVRPPANIGQWLMLAVAGGLFWLSVDATHAALGSWLDWNSALMLQGGISLIERFHFAGNRNGFTWFILAADTALTATGLGMVMLPRLFSTPVYAFVTETLLGGFGAGGFTGLSLGLLALGVGFIIAYGGDKTFDLAMGR